MSFHDTANVNNANTRQGLTNFSFFAAFGSSTSRGRRDKRRELITFQKPVATYVFMRFFGVNTLQLPIALFFVCVVRKIKTDL